MSLQQSAHEEFYPSRGVGLDTRGFTIVVAASNSLDPTLAPVAYRCTGVNDQVIINAAIAAMGVVGGAVILLDGTYDITASVVLASLVALMGQGAGTVLRVPNGHNANLNVVSAIGVNRVLVAGIRVDGNRLNQAAGDMNGVYFEDVTYSKVCHCWLEHTMCTTSHGEGVLLHGSSYNTVLDVNCVDNGDAGILLESSSEYNNIECNYALSSLINGVASAGLYIVSSNRNIISSNVIQGSIGDGITMTSSNNNIISGNNCQEDGISMNSSNNNIISGNNCHVSIGDGIYMNACLNNTVSSNTCDGNSQLADNIYSGIKLTNNCDYNNIHGNTVRHLGGAKQHKYGIEIETADCDGNLVIDNDLYLAGKTANLHDAGTATTIISNRGYNPRGNVATPYSVAAGPLADTAAAQAFPTSATNYTVTESPKLVTIYGGTITSVSIDGVATGQAGAASFAAYRLEPGQILNVVWTIQPSSKVYAT